MKITLVSVLLIVLTVTAPAQQWDFDKVHSTIGFAVRHLVISKTTGKFEDYSGQVMFDGKNLEQGSVEIAIQIASINTDDNKRDDHLRSSDFFNVEKYPVMTFKSKKITKGDGDSFQMTGDLTIKDVTKEVVLDCELGVHDLQLSRRQPFTLIRRG